MFRPLSGETSHELVSKAQEGDQEAFTELVARYGYQLRCLVRLRLGSRLRQRVDVEDILQESFLKAFLSIGSFEWQAEGSFFPWLAGIAEHVIQNQARKHLKARKRTLGREVGLERAVAGNGRKPWKLSELLVAPDVPPSEALQSDERFERLERAFDKLSPAWQEVVLLVLIYELPVKEVAARMGRSPAAVSMQLLRALRQLKNDFGHTDSLKLPDRALVERAKRIQGGQEKDHG